MEIFKGVVAASMAIHPLHNNGKVWICSYKSMILMTWQIPSIEPGLNTT
jgi:hypothetical protein